MPNDTDLMDAIKRELDLISSGEVILTATNGDPQDIYAGNCSYTASNGWKLVVFNDCGEFDYFDSITDPEGNTLEYGNTDSLRPPRRDVAWIAYGIPGYMIWRCTTCGAAAYYGIPFLRERTTDTHVCGDPVMPRRLLIKPVEISTNKGNK